MKLLAIVWVLVLGQQSAANSVSFENGTICLEPVPATFLCQPKLLKPPNHKFSRYTEPIGKQYDMSSC